MIPLVFDSLMEVLLEREFEHLGIHQLRVPADPLTPLLHHKKMRRGVPWINWVKWCILNIHAVLQGFVAQLLSSYNSIGKTV